MAYCQNCGHDSHCGTNKTAKADNSSYPDIADDPTSYEVCKTCRCDDCIDYNDNTR